MSERATQLHQLADGQLSELIGLLSTRDEAALRLPCPGREKLGDGTVAACASHTADNYLRIAAFLCGEDHQPAAHGDRGRGPHRVPSFLRARGHRSGHDQGGHSAPHRAENVDRAGLLERLSSGRDALGILRELTDEQLDAVPPASDMKFCDGQRTLQQIVTNLLNHQTHQLDTLKAALA
jgi:hypothetical protein